MNTAVGLEKCRSRPSLPDCRQPGSYPETGFWEAKAGLLLSVWTFLQPTTIPNPLMILMTRGELK